MTDMMKLLSTANDQLDNLEEAYKQTLEQLHSLKEGSVQWKLVAQGDAIIIQAFRHDFGWYAIGLVFFDRLEAPDEVKGQLSMEGVASVNVSFSLEEVSR